jgi:hypothetical protein
VEILMEAGIEKEFGRRMEVYETPLAQVRGVFLCENVAVGVQSPVDRITLKDWTVVDASEIPEIDIELPLW